MRSIDRLYLRMENGLCSDAHPEADRSSVQSYLRELILSARMDAKGVIVERMDYENRRRAASRIGTLN